MAKQAKKKVAGETPDAKTKTVKFTDRGGNEATKEIPVVDPVIVKPADQEEMGSEAMAEALTKENEAIAEKAKEEEEALKEIELKAAEDEAKAKEDASKEDAAKEDAIEEEDDSDRARIQHLLSRFKARTTFGKGKVIQTSKGGKFVNTATREQWVPLSVIYDIVEMLKD